jgi:predicted MFS family arabinose efflux permease
MLPISLAGLLGDAILTHSDFTTLFIVATGFAVAALLLALRLYDAPRDPLGRVEVSRGFRAMARQRNLLPIWWIATIFSVALAAQFTFLKPFVMDTGAGTVGGFFTGYAGIAILVRLFFGWLPDRLGAMRVLIPALVILATGFLMLAHATTPTEVMTAGMLCGLGHGYTFPILFGLVVTRSRGAERGAAMALYTGLFDVGVLLGGPSLGFIIDHSGYSAMFATAGGLIMMGTISFAIWDWALGRRHP